MGANVIICETDPLRALEAVMDGYNVMPIKKAALVGDIFVTVTGDAGVLRKEHFKIMKDKAILANAGHFDVEIDLKDLKVMSRKKSRLREFIDCYEMKNGRRIYVLGEGRLVNLAAAEGHPASVMDMSFANQALSCRYIIRNSKKLSRKVYSVPAEIDEKIARLKLKSLNIAIDKLTERQRKYLESWELGT
jgi:adenosylhomocysteinase